MVPFQKCSKITYSSKKEAKAFLEECMLSKSHARREKRYYKCPRCGFWHLTSKSSKPSKIDYKNKKMSLSSKEKEWVSIILQIRFLFNGEKHDKT